MPTLAPLVGVVPAPDENKWQYLFQQEHIAEASTFLGITAFSTLAILCGILYVVYRFVIPQFSGVFNHAGGFAQSVLFSFQAANADNVATQLAREEKKKNKKKQNHPKGGEPPHSNNHQDSNGGNGGSGSASGGGGSNSLRKRKGKKAQEEEAPATQGQGRRTSEPKSNKSSKSSKGNSNSSNNSSTSQQSAPSPGARSGSVPYASMSYAPDPVFEEDMEQQGHAQALARLRLKQALKREDTTAATLWMNLVQNGTTQQILDQLANGNGKGKK